VTSSDIFLSQKFFFFSKINPQKSESEPKCLRFPLAYKESLMKLINAKDDEFILLSDLELPASEAVQFAVSLWAEGLLIPQAND